MKRSKRILASAEADIYHIFEWIAARSPQGARTWVDLLEETLAFLENDADSFGQAEENAEYSFDVRQTIFKTRHGNPYRILFFIDGEVVNILRVRGQGQQLIDGPR